MNYKEEILQILSFAPSLFMVGLGRVSVDVEGACTNSRHEDVWSAHRPVAKFYAGVQEFPGSATARDTEEKCPLGWESSALPLDHLCLLPRPRNAYILNFNQIYELLRSL